jgi:hypothetical protein
MLLLSSPRDRSPLIVTNIPPLLLRHICGRPPHGTGTVTVQVRVPRLARFVPVCTGTPKTPVSSQYHRVLYLKKMVCCTGISTGTPKERGVFLILLYDSNDYDHAVENPKSLVQYYRPYRYHLPVLVRTLPLYSSLRYR